MRLSEIPFQPMGMQSAFEPADLERFVAAPRIAVLAYVRRDGTPNQIPIWYAYDGEKFSMLTSSISPKVKAITRAPRVCLTIQDETPPYRAVVLDGNMTLESVDPHCPLHSELSTRYFGRIGGAEYEKMVAEDNEKNGITMMTFEPDRMRGFDNERMLSAPLLAYMKLRNRLPIPAEWL